MESAAASIHCAGDMHGTCAVKCSAPLQESVLSGLAAGPGTWKAQRFMTWQLGRWTYAAWRRRCMLRGRVRARCGASCSARPSGRACRARGPQRHAYTAKLWNRLVSAESVVAKLVHAEKAGQQLCSLNHALIQHAAECAFELMQA